MAAREKGSTVAIKCRLPHGLTLHHPLDYNDRVVLKGMNSSQIIGATYVVTEIPVAFWEAWYSANKGTSAALKSGAIYFDEKGADDKFAAVKTGLEPLKPREHGVKPVPKQDDPDEADTDEDDGKAAAA